MKRTLLALATTFAMALAVPAMADLNSVPAQVPGATGHVEGHVALVTPMSLYVDTAAGLQKFDITAQSKGENDLGPGDYVEVYYKNLAENGHNVAVQWHRTARATPEQSRQMKSKLETRAANQLAGTDHVEGTVEEVSPDALTVDSSHGLMTFLVTTQSKTPNDLVAGDEVNVWYRPANEAGKVEVVSVNRNAGAMKQAQAQETRQPQEQQPARVAENTPKPAAQMSPQRSSQPAARHAMQPKTTRLPQTASDLPLVGVLGLVSLAGAGTIRFFRG